MKKLILILSVLICASTAFSQDLGIIPNPQQIEYQQGSFLWKADLSKNEKRIKTEIVKDIPAKENKEQAYIINITPKKIILRAMTEQGLFYACHEGRGHAVCDGAAALPLAYAQGYWPPHVGER